MFFESDLKIIANFSFPNINDVCILNPHKVVVKNTKSDFVYFEEEEEVALIKNIQKKHVIINLSASTIYNFPFNFETTQGIISFDVNEKPVGDFFVHRFYYMRKYLSIDRKKSTISWLLSYNLKSIKFLRELNNDSSKIVDLSNLFSFISDARKLLLVKLGGLDKVANGKIHILKKNKFFFEGLSSLEYESCTVKTSDTLQKEVLKINFYDTKNRNTHIGEYNLVPNHLNIKNKEEILKKLQKEKLYIPQFFTIKNLIVFENDNFRQKEVLELKQKHYQVINEYYAKFQAEQTVIHLFRKNQILKKLEIIKIRLKKGLIPNALSLIATTKFYVKLIKLFNSIEDEKIPVSLANGNINSDNFYAKKQKIWIIDWQKANFEYPILYDFFYFIFHHIEKQENPNFEKLKKYLKELKNNPNILEINKKYKLKYQLHLKLFAILKFTDELYQSLDDLTINVDFNKRIYIWEQFISNLTSEINKNTKYK